MTIKQWHAKYYDQSVSYVTQLGESLIDILDPKEGETILDLGCGTGHLTAKISKRGATTIGIDLSPDMIEEAKRTYPELDFRLANAESFQLEKQVDAVFSNAALHWIKNAIAVSDSVFQCLKVGGRYVAELGGQNNVVAITDALYQALEEKGVAASQVYNPWYFPSVGEYTTILENSGFTVTQVFYFERPTPLDDCPHGLEDWIRIFADDFLHSVEEAHRDDVIRRTIELARPILFQDGKWFADYRRLRFVAIKNKT